MCYMCKSFLLRHKAVLVEVGISLLKRLSVRREQFKL